MKIKKTLINKENKTKLTKLSLNKNTRRLKKLLKKRDIWVKSVVIASALALIAASVLPYLLI